MNTRQTITILTLAALLTVAATAIAQTGPLLPRVAITSPYAVTGQLEAAQLPSSPNFTIGANSNDPGVSITSYRTLLKPALLPDGNYADTRIDFETNQSYLLSFDDEAWTEWQLWPGGAADVPVSYTDLPQVEDDPNNPGQTRAIYYLFAAQVMTADGVISVERQYGLNVANFRITQNLAPTLAIHHPLLGSWKGTGANQITAIDLLAHISGEFQWEAEGDGYGGTIESYRWGWDVLDVDDPDDPGWALPPGLTDAHKHSGPIPFEAGIHTLTVRAVDNYGALSQRVFVLDFVPVPDPSNQYPLLLVDDVKDRNSNAWTDQQGIPRDRDEHRDSFWLDVLSTTGGVAGFELARDVIDAEIQSVEIRDVVNYRAVVWSSRWVSYPNSAIARTFRPIDSQWGPIQQRYVWLGSYQESVGNLLLAGSRAANDFVPESPYMLPVIYGSAEGNTYGWTFENNEQIRVGFGADQLGDPAHLQMHGYRNLGLAAFDVMSPNATYYTPDGWLLRTRRQNTCAAQKGLTLDADFVANHMPGGAAFADTIWTEQVIDWRDQDPAVADDLATSYHWSNDEFYDADVLGRDSAVVPQNCDGEACVEPLLRSISRFDWNRQRHAQELGDEWPQDYYGVGDIDTGCGLDALDGDRTTSRTNDQVTAFVTHKFEDQKPSQVGDVVMGFDPYRFDNEQMKDALRWVLGEHFGLDMNP